MSRSSNAIIFYGYCWNSEDTDPESDDDEFEPDMDEAVTAILKERGHANPWDNWANTGTWRADNEGAIETWWLLHEAVRQELGVDWGAHCSSGTSMPYLFIPDTEITAYRGYPKPIPALETRPHWKEKLDAFLASQGINPPKGENQPGWWTASYAEIG